MWIYICTGWILASVLLYTYLVYSSKELSPEESLDDNSSDYIEYPHASSTSNTISKAA